jgi:uncharacterized protein (UPF0276 family)
MAVVGAAMAEAVAAEVVDAGVAEANVMKDRVGIGWRPELAAGILSNLDCIDLVEVMADDLFDAPRAELRAMQTLAAQVPVVVHGVSLGLASAEPLAAVRLDKLARVVGAIEPEFWSEHLAFVRSDGVEIGHLAAPPRTDATIEGTAKNLTLASRIVGSAPFLENIATLIDPPGSSYDEAAWISRIVNDSNAELLLDLHNLYANASNFHADPAALLTALPLESVRSIHLAGGKWIAASSGEKRLLDDHLHDVPDAVYDLLTQVGSRTSRPLSIILERDGAYPAFDKLRAQIERAREAIAVGRLQAFERKYAEHGALTATARSAYRARSFEAYLARLYVDGVARARFLEDPLKEARNAGLDQSACEALAEIDSVGLELAARSFASKRHSRKR